MRSSHPPANRQRHRRKLVWLALACAGVFAGFATAGARASRARDLPREPALLDERQVSRGIDTRLQQMRQRHESNRAARQAESRASGQARNDAAATPALRREPAELSVQPLPRNSE